MKPEATDGATDVKFQKYFYKYVDLQSVLCYYP